VAGTGATARPAQALSPLRQARRFDPEGAYVHRYLPELEALPGARAHEPWRARPKLAPGYPAPIVELEPKEGRRRPGA
jgi:deoxyribodipyrimidine photo-lyase